MTNRTYERLFCCECGTEVPEGKAGRVVPALQQPPSTGGMGGSPRPHVWCQTCLGEEQRAAKKRPKPGDLVTPAFELHRYIWSVGEGRTDKEIQKYWGVHLWGEKLSTLLRELTEAGKIEKRGDRRVALCSPWADDVARAAHESKGPPSTPHFTPQVAADVPKCQVCGLPYADPVCPHMDPRCGSCPLDCDEEDACSPPLEDEALAIEVPDEEALNADRYPLSKGDVSAYYERLNRIEQKLDSLFQLVHHLTLKADR